MMSGERLQSKGVQVPLMLANAASRYAIWPRSWLPTGRCHRPAQAAPARRRRHCLALARALGAEFEIPLDVWELLWRDTASEIDTSLTRDPPVFARPGGHRARCDLQIVAFSMPPTTPKSPSGKPPSAGRAPMEDELVNQR